MGKALTFENTMLLANRNANAPVITASPPSCITDDAKSASADAARAKYTQNAMPHVLEALWNASALDIEHTIRNVCFKVRGFPVSHAPPSRLRILVLRREHYDQKGRLFQSLILWSTVYPSQSLIPIPDIHVTTD